MSRAYQLTRIADKDLTKIWRSTRKRWSSRQADKYLTELEACFLELAEHPELGRSRPNCSFSSPVIISIKEVFI